MFEELECNKITRNQKSIGINENKIANHRYGEK